MSAESVKAAENNAIAANTTISYQRGRRVRPISASVVVQRPRGFSGFVEIRVNATPAGEA
jgi:hypothetical protein